MILHIENLLYLQSSKEKLAVQLIFVDLERIPVKILITRIFYKIMEGCKEYFVEDSLVPFSH